MKEKLLLSLKLTAKRFLFRASAVFLRLFPRSKFAERVAQSAREHGLGKNDSPPNTKSTVEVAVFDQLIPTPDRDAGSARMVFILRALSQWCHPVFIPLGKRLWPEYEKQLWGEGIETASVLSYKQLLKDRKIAAVVLSRPAVAAALLGSVRRVDPRSEERRVGKECRL